MRSAFPAKVRNAGRIRVWLAGAERTLAARSPLLDLVRADAVTRSDRGLRDDTRAPRPLTQKSKPQRATVADRPLLFGEEGVHDGVGHFYGGKARRFALRLSPRCASRGR